MTEILAAAFIGVGAMGVGFFGRWYCRAAAAERAQAAIIEALREGVTASNPGETMADTERLAAMACRRRAEIMGLGIKAGKL